MCKLYCLIPRNSQVIVLGIGWLPITLLCNYFTLTLGFRWTVSLYFNKTNIYTVILYFSILTCEVLVHILFYSKKYTGYGTINRNDKLLVFN